MEHENPSKTPPAVLWERVGDEVIVSDPSTPTVRRLTGDDAHAFLVFADSQARGDAPAGLTGNDLSRRFFLTGAAGGAVIVSLSLPTRAAASSHGAPPPPGPTLIDADVSLANWRVDAFDGGFFLLNLANLDQPAFGTLFEVGDEWAIDIIDFGDNLQQTRLVSLQGGIRRLVYDFTGVGPPAGAITVRLRSATKNLVSAQLTVPLIV